MDAKWGSAILDDGWTAIPNKLLKNAAQLDLDPTETLTLIYLVRFWWTADEMPYPSISKTSEQMGVTRKTLGKKFASLEDKGLIKLVETGGKRSYSLSGLKDALAKLTEATA